MLLKQDETDCHGCGIIPLGVRQWLRFIEVIGGLLKWVVSIEVGGVY